MNKVYFSKDTVDDMDKWDNCGGELKCFIYPKNIFSIKEWIFAIGFMKKFNVFFLEVKE